MLTDASPSPPVHSAYDMTVATQINPLRIGSGGLNDTNDPKARWYATRVATVILVRDDGKIIFVERDRSKLENGEVVAALGERREVFTV